MTIPTIIPAMFTKISTYKHNDFDETVLVCGINVTAGLIAEAYKITKNGTAVKIASASAYGKDDSIAGVVFADGTVRLFVSEADTGGSGTTSAVRMYDYPKAFPPAATPLATNIDSNLRTLLKSLFTTIRDQLTNIITHL